MESAIHFWSSYSWQEQSLAVWTRNIWEEFGVPHTELVPYHVYLNYPEPMSQKLALVDGDNSIVFQASLKEDVLDEDSASNSPVPNFHGYSASGSLIAGFVFVNYATANDFRDLMAANVSLANHIAIAKYSTFINRGMQLLGAQNHGMTGMILYSDPGDDGNITEANGYKQYPHGPARQESSVQRGSVMYLSLSFGDPTTPGYPSKPGAPRIEPSAIPKIPSLPISYRDAIPILKALKGHGPKSESLGEWWREGGLGYRGVEYYVGPSPPERKLYLSNRMENPVIVPIWNVIGVINGTISDEVLIIGNHRDAWVRGAADPASGSAALNELVRSFGVALSKGWKPRRTIVFASWDGEEYGLLGSTEWVEEYLPWLKGSAIAYLNVDVALKSSEMLYAKASPLLKNVFTEATKLVPSPNPNATGQTLYDIWSKRIGLLGSGSDYAAFQHAAGIPSLDMTFSRGDPTEMSNQSVYHYHSVYDSNTWMEKFGDPGWHFHVAMTRLWAVIAAKLAGEVIIPFKVADYANSLNDYLDAVREKLRSSRIEGSNMSVEVAFAPLNSVDKLQAAIEDLQKAAAKFDSNAEALAHSVENEPIPKQKWWKWVKRSIKVCGTNTVYKLFERNFLYEAGLDDRTLFKHVVFAPAAWTGYGGAAFPGLNESIEKGDKANFERWTGIIMEAVKKAGRLSVWRTPSCYQYVFTYQYD